MDSRNHPHLYHRSTQMGIRLRWVCGSTTTGTTESAQEDQTNNLMGEKFSELLNNSTDSHYQFLGVPAEVDLEEIKAAYRRLSKEYHPNNTSLPLKIASEKCL
ncbi:hypothetical protein L2E82_20614 [Cichorium intybus]|uniref:Uncharacterized protein n=1 Tax=Cichorium intybus TaxID=13427 RepID=A0ACB9DU62_CICIN|nr:hypothetical protein L2E82_20614 [Cichorium intybus]